MQGETSPTEITQCLFLLRQHQACSKVSTVHDNWSVFSLTPAERHTEAHLASLPFRSYHFNTNCDHLGCSVRAMGTGMKAHENVHSIPGLCPPRGCPDYRCQVLCLQQSQQVMHKFTDSSNGTSFSNKK